VSDFLGKTGGRLKSLFGGRANAAPRADAHSSLDKRLVIGLSGRRWPKPGQLKHLPRFLSPGEKKTVHLLVGIILLALVVAGGRFTSAHLETVPADGGQYVEASVGGPRFANPLLALTNDADLDLVRLMFSGLMKTDVDGKVVPDLAESYAVSEDGRTYTFTLREGLTWHDGKALTSRDVAATIGYAKNPAWKSPLASQFKNVTVEAPDDRTVTFTLAEPFAPFLSLLTVGILPSHLWDEVLPENAARAELNVKPVGAGPFKFKNFTQDKQGTIHTYALERFGGYHGARPHLDAITFRYYPDLAAAHDALVKHEADGLSFLPLEYRDTAETLRSARAYTLRLPQYTAVFFNQKRDAALRTKEVRQALAMAVDRDAVLKETLRTDGVLVNAPILAGFTGFHPDVKKVAYDPATAEKLLDQAGWKKAEDGIRKKQMTNDKKETEMVPLSVTITTADAKENLAAAEAVKRGWTAIGVQAAIDAVPASRIQKDHIRTREYDALLYGEIIGADPDPYPFWHSSQAEGAGLNLAGWSNRRADELLEKARASADPAARETMYKEFQDILAEDVPAIFLYSPTYTYVVGRKIKGIEPATIFTPADRFAAVEEWYVKTSKSWK
jgi:peptide/nickel transport system substrate-binding protein